MGPSGKAANGQEFLALLGQFGEMPANPQFSRAPSGQLEAIKLKLMHKCRISAPSGKNQSKKLQNCSF
jgi:hypothetical protein